MQKKSVLSKIITMSVLAGSILVSSCENPMKSTYSINDDKGIVVGNTIKGSSQIRMITPSQHKTVSYEKAISELNQKNKQLNRMINKYKTQEKMYQQQIKNLQHTSDSLENVCSSKKKEISELQKENSELELYAIEYEHMNERYGNLPYYLEKKISNYLSRKK